MNNNKICFSFTSDEAEIVLYTLGQLPYNKVYSLIENIKSQMENSTDCPSGGNTIPEAISPPENMV